MMTTTSAPAQAALPHSGAGTIRISYEVIAYVVIIALALALRVAELDTVPLNAAETHDALAAWRSISPEAPGDALISSSPINQLLLAMGMATLGANEFAARILFVLFGTSIILLPLAFRPLLGRTRALLFSIALACSPTLLIASREASGSTVALFFALMMLWAFWKLVQTRRGTFGAAGVVFGVMGALLTDAAGLWIVGVPLVALAVAAFGHNRSTERFAFTDAEADEATARPLTLQSFLGLIPWTLALPVSALIVVATGTAFLLNPNGLTSVGAVIAGWIGGFTVPSSPDAPLMYPFVVSIFYETFAWGFGVIAVIVLMRRYSGSFVERFFIAWIGVGIIVSLIWQGGRADHAILFAVPLAGLVAALLHALIETDDPTNRPYWPAPFWARWVLALVIGGLLLAFASSLHSLAQDMLAVPEGNLAAIAWDVPTLVLFVVTFLFVIVAFFMAGSVWDTQTALRGVGLGVLIFGFVTSLGAGWNTAVPYADRASELWRLQAIHRDTFLLRETLLEVGLRQARGFTGMPVTVLATQDGPVAWAVRDFPEATFETDPAAAIGDAILLVGNGTFPGDNGVPYVGQDFTQMHYWSPGTLFAGDVLAYWTQGLTRTTITSLANAEIWLRQDVYDGTDMFADPRG